MGENCIVFLYTFRIYSLKNFEGGELGVWFSVAP